VTSPAHRCYDNSPRDNKHHVSNYSACDRDSQPANRAELAVSTDLVDSLHRGRRLDLANAAAAAANDDDDDDDGGGGARHEMTRTAVRPWLLHSCDH